MIKMLIYIKDLPYNESLDPEINVEMAIRSTLMHPDNGACNGTDIQFIFPTARFFVAGFVEEGWKMDGFYLSGTVNKSLSLYAEILSIAMRYIDFHMAKIIEFDERWAYITSAIINRG